MQLLLNAINPEVVTKLAAICYEMNRLVSVQMGDTSNAPWPDLSGPDRLAWSKWVQGQMDNNFLLEEPDEDADAEDKMIYTKLMAMRAVLLSVLSTWSGAPQMGPQIPVVPYDPPEPPEVPEEDPDPEEEPDDEDVTVVDDDEDDDQSDEPTGETPEEELTPAQKAARTRAANKAAKEKEDG